jgi:phage replication O-like protein O
MRVRVQVESLPPTRTLSFTGGDAIKGREYMRTPNYTQVPNPFIDDDMKKISGPAVQVYLCICRKTIGWHKLTDRIGICQLEKMTGLSKPTILLAVRQLVNAGLVFKEGKPRTMASFELNLEQPSGKESLPDPPPSGKATLPDTSKSGKESLHTKDSNINKGYAERFKPLVALYFKLYEKRFGKKPAFDASEGKALKNLMSLYPQGELELLIGKYIETEDKFYRHQGYSIKFLQTAIRGLRLSADAIKKRQVDPAVIEAVRKTRARLGL